VHQVSRLRLLSGRLNKIEGDERASGRVLCRKNMIEKS